jgi:competence protein ComEC
MRGDPKDREREGGALSMRPGRAFRGAVVAFVCGIFLGSLVSGIGGTLSLFLIIPALAIVGIFQSRRSLVWAGVLLSFSFGLFIIARAESAWDRERAPVHVSGIADIVRKPETREYAHIALARLVECGDEGCPEGLVEVRFPLLETIEYGERGSFSCALEPPDREWRMWYASRGIGYRCRDPKWDPTSTTRPIRRALLAFTSRFENAILRYLPEPESGLAAGLLLGGDKRLPEEVREAFRDAGLTHIVAVSGYNISIIAEYFLFFGILLTLPRRRAAPFALLGTAGFVFIAGAPPSATRALFMAGTLMLAQWFGRRYESLFALVFVAALMLLFNPLLLFYDVGFQLSFLATAGIVLASPLVGRVIRRVPKPASPFLEAFLITIAANLLLIPILLSTFGRFVPTAIPVNTILLPLVPLSMFLSFLVGLFGTFSSILGTMFSFPAYAALHVIIEGARFGASFGDSAIETDQFGWGFSVLWYVILIWIFFRIRRRSSSSGRGKGSLSSSSVKK